MGPTSGSISTDSIIGAGWLAHLPLWVVIGLGGLVMLASETPEAARRPVGRVATGAISPAPGLSLSSLPFSMPVTLTNLGLVPEASRILHYQDELALTEIAPEILPSGWIRDTTPTPERAGAGLASLRHSYEQRRQSMRAPLDEDETTDDRPSVEVSKDHPIQGPDEVAPVLQQAGSGDSPQEANFTRNAETIADEMTGSSGLIDLRHRQHKIADFLARYYRRSKDDIRRYIRYAYESAQRNGVDPLLVVGIMCIESSMNPRATSHKGAKGLMQVLVKAHTKRFKPFGGTKNAYDPRTSIEVGTRIIAGMINRTGTVKKALKHYVGAANFRSDAGYGNKVIGMRDRVWAASMGRRIPSKPNIKVAVNRAEKAQSQLDVVVIASRR